MADKWRDDRRAELLTLWKQDPLRVLTIYRKATGLGHRDPLPQSLTPIQIIEAIIDFEAGLRGTP